VPEPGVEALLAFEVERELLDIEPLPVFEAEEEEKVLDIETLPLPEVEAEKLAFVPELDVDGLTLTLVEDVVTLADTVLDLLIVDDEVDSVEDCVGV
jgi:hypothetical protein